MIRSSIFRHRALATMLPAAAFLLAPAPAAGQEPPLPPSPPEHSMPLLAPEPVPHHAMSLLREGGAWLGVRIAEVKDEVKPGSGTSYGALVTAVEDDSPAARAGLKPDDVIVSFQGQRVESAAALTRLVRETPAGRNVSLGVRRAGAERRIEARLEERPARSAAPLVPGIEIPDLPYEDLQRLGDPRHWGGLHGRLFAGAPRLGVEVESVGGQMAEFFGVGEKGGVLIKEVHPGSAAERAGLRAGDVIVRVASRDVATVDDLREALSEAEGDSVALGVVRERRERTIQAPLEERQESRRRAPRGQPRPPERSGRDRI